MVIHTKFFFSNQKLWMERYTCAKKNVRMYRVSLFTRWNVHLLTEVVDQLLVCMCKGGINSRLAFVNMIIAYAYTVGMGRHNLTLA